LEFVTSLTIDILGRTEDLHERNAEWIGLCPHPEAHPALFKAVADVNPDLIRPHVVLVSRAQTVIAIAVARIQYERIPLKLGPISLPTPRLRVLRLSYDGVMGETSPEVFATLNSALTEPLNTGEADALLWDHVRIVSPAALAASQPGPMLQRDLSPVTTTLHWSTAMDQDFEAFLRGLSKGERSNYKKNVKKLEEHFAGRLRSVCYQSIDDFDVIMRDTLAIADLTYQRAIGASFADQIWAQSWLKSSLELGIARCFVVYIDDEPTAFVLGHVWKGRLITHFMGYDPELSDFGVGRYINFKMIAAACADADIKHLDFGFGDALYKRRICKTMWEEVDRFIFARRLKPMAVNVVRGGIGHAIHGLDKALNSIGLREHLRALIWRRIKQPSGAGTPQKDAATS
jgi:hypothetical protein